MTVTDPASTDAEDFDVERWRADLEANRAEKDRFFAEHPQSPVPPDERDAFDGLAYFEPDPTYRVRATLTVHEEPEPVTMETTAGRELRYERAATLRFQLERDDPDLADGRFELAAYLPTTGEPVFFVPFRDKTTGQQSYTGGRYMELAVEDGLDDLETGDELVLDFNLAYTPFCAFSETFECPLPPEENWLAVAVPAGERAP